MSDLILSIELTTRCNSHCDFCTHDQLIKSGKRPSMELPLAEAKRRIDILSQKYPDAKFIIPTGLGEPLLYPDLLEVVRYIKKKWPNASVGINTNGILLKNDLIGELDIMTISLCYPTKLQYERHMGTKQYERVIRNIKEFMKAKGNQKPRVRVHIFKKPVNVMLYPFHYVRFKRIMKTGWTYMEPYLDLVDNKCPSDPQENSIMVGIGGEIYNSCMGVWYPPEETKHLLIGRVDETK